MQCPLTSSLSSVAQSYPTVCDPMDCSTPGLPVHHQLPEFTQTHVHGWWCHPTISSSAVPFSSCLQSFPALNSFQMSQLAKVLEFQLQHHSNECFSFNIIPMNVQDWFPLEWTGWISLQSKGLKNLLQHHSSKASILWRSALFIVQLSHPYMTTRKNIAFTKWTFVGKIMSLLFNMLSRLVITFLPRSKCLLISWLQSPSAVILEPKKIKYVTVSIVSPSICHEMMGPDAMALVFWMLSFKPTFSLSSFTFIKKLFSSSSLSSRRVCHLHIWGYWYFSQKSWFQLVLHPAQSFSWCTLHMLNKQGDNIQPWRTPFPIWNQCVVPCPVLTVASWPAYRFLKRQVRKFGIPISFKIFHSLLWSTQSFFGIASKAEIDVFLEPSCFFEDPTDVGNLISGSSSSSAFSKTSLNIWKFTVHVLLKTGLGNFEVILKSIPLWLLNPN